ncbi:MAG: NADH:flavin oxidoreductase [Pseudomonadota bacterium]
MTIASSDPLLQPFHLGHLKLRNRVMSTSHACGLGDKDHMPGEAYQSYHVAKARGGLALTMFGGSSYVSQDSKWSGSQLSVATDQVIPHLQQFSDRVHAEGAALMIQITHLGRRAETNTQAWMPTLAPSPIRERGHRSIPRQIDRGEMERIVREFGDAAVRCKEGGLDGLEVMTHGHLIGQFLSPETNRRTDDFGGSAENRARFGLMVLEEIRSRVGSDFIVGLRYAIDEGIAGGQDSDDCLAIAKLFEDRGLIDFVNANYGRLDTELALVVDCMPGMQERQSPWLEKAAAFKREIELPVFHAAKINDIATARHAIRAGLLDMVAMTRAHIADPDIVAKLKRGAEDRIRPCVGAVHCMSENRPTCLHNPASGRERFFSHRVQPTTGPKRKIVVLGGGPSGMEAARISAERGHDVVLFEAGNALGGQLRLADKASWRRDVRGIVDWRESELAHLNVDVRLNTYAEAEDVTAESPDVVIIATGGIPDFSFIEGGDLCTSAWDVLGGQVQLGDDVVVYDGTGRHPAPTVAEMLAAAGLDVSYYMIDDVPAKNWPMASV